MKKRKTILTTLEKNQIIDLFEKSPLTVTAIAKAYEVNRLTIYNLMERWDNGISIK